MKIDRLVSIIMLLLEQERVGAQTLAELFEVSPRTIYRDIDAINMAGIPIRSTSGVGGGFEIMQSYKLDKSVFSASELSAILMGLSNLSSVVRGEELVNALAKVQRFVPADRAKDIAIKGVHFVCSSSSVCQICKCKRRALRLGSMKDRSWNLMMFWTLCKGKSKSEFIAQSWTGFWIIATMNTSRLMETHITSWTFPSLRTITTTICC